MFFKSFLCFKKSLLVLAIFLNTFSNILLVTFCVTLFLDSEIQTSDITLCYRLSINHGPLQHNIAYSITRARVKLQSGSELVKNTPYLALMGKLWGIFLEFCCCCCCFLPEASFGLRVLSSPLYVYLSVCVYQSLACLHDNSSAVQARITKFET